MLKRAVGMTVINIGELIKNVSQETRKQYPQIPWRAVAGMRDMAAHKYQMLRMEDGYYTAKEDFPALKADLEMILKALILVLNYNNYCVKFSSQVNFTTKIGPFA